MTSSYNGTTNYFGTECLKSFLSSAGIETLGHFIKLME